ncbi:MAG: FAD-dependent oxidoreductase [Zavarzinella sp.]
MIHCEVLVIGQGLAGTILSWELLRQGFQVHIVDHHHGSTSSQLAAGLITPVTGKRFAHSWCFEDLLVTATEFYQQLETDLGSKLFFQQPHLRLLQTELERSVVEKKLRDPMFQRYLKICDEQLSDPWIAHPFGAVALEQCYRVDVPKMLQKSLADWQQRGIITESYLQESDIEVQQSKVVIPNLGITANRVVFAQGYLGHSGGLWQHIPFNCAKGETITVEIPGFTEHRLIHRRIWLLHQEKSLYRVGATYTWESLDCLPTETARGELLEYLSQMLTRPVTVVDQQAGVRPIIIDQRPVIGWHPEHPHLGIFNGFGSKGALQIPAFARELVGNIRNVAAITPEANVARFVR